MHHIRMSDLIRTYWHHRMLIKQLTKKEVLGRFQGAHLSYFWVILEPLLMLSVYVVVFKFIFHRHWYSEDETALEFAAIIFSGLLVFNFFRQSVSSSPRLIINNVNYVKKVVFPLEVLPLVNVLASLFNLCISLLILSIIYLSVFGYLHLEILYTPLILFPLFLFVLGLTLFLASLGVYFRDVSQLIGLVVMSTLFLSAIFYPIELIPEKYQVLFYLNPVAFTINQFRKLWLMGHPPEWLWLMGYYIFSLLVAWLGFYWFQKTRKGFADVI